MEVLPCQGARHVPGVPQAGEVSVLAGTVGKKEASHLSWSTQGDAWFLMPGPEPAVLCKGLVLLVIGILFKMCFY